MPLSILRSVTQPVKSILAPVTAAIPAPVRDVVQTEVNLVKSVVQPVTQPVVGTLRSILQPQAEAVRNTASGQARTVESVAASQLPVVTAAAQPATSALRPVVDTQIGIIKPIAPAPVAGLLGQIDLDSLGTSLDGAVSDILNDPAAFIEALLEGLNLEAISALDLMMLSNLLEGLQTQLEGLLGGAEDLPVDPEQLTSVTEDLGMLSDIFADLTDPFGELPMLDGLVPAPDGALPVLPELPAAGGNLPPVTELTSEDVDNPGGNQTAPSVAFFNSLNNQSPDAFAMRVANATARNNTGNDLNDIDPASGEIPEGGQTAPAGDLLNATLGSLTGGEDSPLAPVTDLVGLLSMSLPLGALTGAM